LISDKSTFRNCPWLPFLYTLGVNGSMTVSKTAGGGSNPSGYAKFLIAGIQAIGQSHKLGPEVSNTSSATNFALLSLMVEVLSCKQGVLVRFQQGAPVISY